MSCSSSAKMQRPVAGNLINKDTYIYDLLQTQGGIIDTVLKNSVDWNVQIMFTQIDRRANGKPKLTTHTYNINTKYFYPASTVKLPVALLAMQRINELRSTGISANATMITEAAFSGQTPVYNDPNTPDGRPTIANYIKKIFLVSDNDAFNRLYEFLGQEYINEQLHQKGYTDVEILHRLSIFLTPEENRNTNPVNFYDSAGRIIYAQPAKRNAQNYSQRNDLQGKGYYSGDQLINQPMNFSGKNRISLPDLHSIMIGLVFPAAIPASSRFNITEEDRNFALKYMSSFPGESTFPAYDKSEYHDAYTKFLYHGGEAGDLNRNLRVFNKSGDAYGQLLDIAYVADLKNDIEFFLSAVITCNPDGILNDDKYAYDEIGLPFMKALGRFFYTHELARTKKRSPDLTPFTFTYDK